MLSVSDVTRSAPASSMVALERSRRVVGLSRCLRLPDHVDVSAVVVASRCLDRSARSRRLGISLRTERTSLNVPSRIDRRVSFSEYRNL